MAMFSPSRRSLRLASGLVLFTYLAAHLFNHALALCSVAAANDMLAVAASIWRSLPGSVLLYSAALLHLWLALETIALRPHWRLPVIEVVRLWAGFSLPLLLIGHVVMTRVHPGIEAPVPDYQAVVSSLVTTGAQGWQIALLAPGWVHGCLGLWISLRRYRALARLKLLLAGVAIALPIAAAAGFLRMASAVEGFRPLPPLHPIAPQDHDRTVAMLVALAPWREGMMALYLTALLSAGAFSLWRIRRTGRQTG